MSSQACSLSEEFQKCFHKTICLNCAAHSLPDVVCITCQEKGGREKIRKREEEEEEEKEEEKEKSQRRKRKRGNFMMNMSTCVYAKCISFVNLSISSSVL